MKQFGRISVTVSIFLLLLVAESHAKVLLPVEVPPNLPYAQRQVLEKKKAELLKQRDLLKAKVKKHNQKCRGISPDSPLVEECKGEQKALQAEVDKYAASVKQFKTEVVEAGASVPLHEDSEFPDIDRMLLGVQRIRVPPPIPPQDAVIGVGQLAPNDKTSKRVLQGLEGGVATLDIIGRLGSVALPAKLILVAGKSFIAAENAADVYLVKKTELYEQASAYLKDPKTRLRFTEIVRNIKANKPVPEDANIEMLRAAKAILDPKLGNSGMRIAWDAMLSPGACNAALTKACIELGGVALGGSVKISKRIMTIQNPAYLNATTTLTKARRALEKTKNAEAKVKLRRIIKEANEKIEGTYRVSPPEKFAGWSLDTLFKHTEEDLRGE